MAHKKYSRIGNYEITGLDNKIVWAKSLPFGEDLKSFKTVKAAEAYARKKTINK